MKLNAPVITAATTAPIAVMIAATIGTSPGLRPRRHGPSDDGNMDTERRQMIIDIDERKD